MSKIYNIVAITEDFGSIKNEKTGKFEVWKGRRLVCLEMNKDDNSGVITESITKVFKASKELDKTVPTNAAVDLLYDANGRVKKVEVLKK